MVAFSEKYYSKYPYATIKNSTLMTQIIRDEFKTFDPRGYLDEYYSDLGDENLALLAFFADAYKDFEADSLEAIEIGGGPTVYQLISLAPVAKNIEFTDYLDANLEEVSSWASGYDSAFDWDNFIAEALLRENLDEDIRHEAIARRREVMQRKIVSLAHCDIFAADIVNTDKKYDLLSTNFCAESVCHNKESVAEVIGKYASLIKTDGYLVMTGLLGAEYWHIGGKTFTSASLSKEEIPGLFANTGFEILEQVTTPSQYERNDPDYQGYDGMFMVKAIRRA